MSTCSTSFNKDDKESLEIICQISDILNTGLNREALATCVRLIEAGVNPEALAVAVKDLKDSLQTTEVKFGYSKAHTLDMESENTPNIQPENDENKIPQPSSSSSSQKTRLKIKIKHWKGVASWRWLANDDSCGICRMPFDACCADCKLPGDDCPLVWGQCTHCFHIHCIMKWLNSQSVKQLCPMCRQEWKFKE